MPRPPNHGIAPPVIEKVVRDGTKLTATGRVQMSVPLGTTIELFGNRNTGDTEGRYSSAKRGSPQAASRLSRSRWMPRPALCRPASPPQSPRPMVRHRSSAARSVCPTDMIGRCSRPRASSA